MIMGIGIWVAMGIWAAYYGEWTRFLICMGVAVILASIWELGRPKKA